MSLDSVQESRIWTVLFSFMFVNTICLMLGAFWMYNQWNITIRNQEQMLALTKHVDDRYVDKDLLAAYTVEQNRRFNEIDKKLDSIDNKAEIIHKYLSAR